MAHLFFFHLLKHRHRLANLFLEVATHQVKHLPDQGIPYRIKDLVAGFSRHHDLSRSKNREVLREICLLQLQLLNKIAYRQFTFSQQIDDRNARRMRQGLENLSFELTQ